LWITVYAASSLGRTGVFLRGKTEYRQRYGQSGSKSRHRSGRRLGGMETMTSGALASR
jgi:hypothetical protein